MSGFIGLYSWFRPSQLHWQFMFGHDCVVVVLAAIDLGASTAGALNAYWYEYGFASAWPSVAALTVLAVTVAAFTTFRLRHRGPSRTPKEEMYSLEDGRPNTTYTPQPYQPVEHTEPASPSPTRKPVGSRTPSIATAIQRQPSQAMSKTETVARWSGVSEDVSTVVPDRSDTIRSNRSTVPPYTAGPYSPMVEEKGDWN